MSSQKIKKDFYSAQYFLKTKKIVEKFLPKSIVTVQFFQRKDNAILAGIDEVIKFLKVNCEFKKIKVKALKEGSLIQANEVVLQIEGNFSLFGHFENIIDGILTRFTSIASNANNIKKVANPKPVIVMSDRCDHFLMQPYDGYAASVGGLKTQVTLAQTSLHNGEAIGTVPHILIQMFEGDLIKALKAFQKTFKHQKLIALVDFNNDVITDSLAIANYFQKDLYAVRVDTALNLSDKYFDNKVKKEFGVTPNLIKALRRALNKNGYDWVKIIVSSGFDDTKISFFESKNTPVDIYGVGQALLKINNTFTCDAVKINGKKIAKLGRYFQNNPRLKKVL